MNKTQKKQKCRDILHSYELNSIIKNEGEVDFLLSIFSNHHHWDIKKGSGVKNISISGNGLGKYFQLNRFDGSCTDISFLHSISSPSKSYYINKACRSSVSDIVYNFRMENVIFGETVCPFSGVVLYKENTHIDHYDLTFNEVYKKWVLENDYDTDYLYSRIKDGEDNNTDIIFKDDNIIISFVKFHNENTKLRAVSKETNMSLLKKNQL